MYDVMLDNVVTLTKLYNGRNVNKMNESYIFDRFGILTNKPNLPYIFKDYSAPQHTDKSLITICKERAQGIGKINLAWSGGIDSTFVLAIYKDLGLDINVIYVDLGKEINEQLKNYVSNNFNLQIKKPDELSDDKIYTGACADILFDSVARRNGGKVVNNGVVKLIDLPNPPYEGGIRWLDDYANYLGVKLETQEDILRIVVLCFKFYFYCYSNGVPSILGTNQESFFDTQEFTDYAFTNCWHRQGLRETDVTYKKIQKNYIAEVFGSDFGVSKNE